VITAPQPVVADPGPAGSATETVVAQQAQARRGVEWRLMNWIVNGSERPILPESLVTISFDPSGKIAGSASVNRFSGTYRFDADGRLQWPQSSFTLTRVAGPPPLMAQERAFLESLRRTVTYRTDGQQLVLESHSGSTVLTFQK
jgi:heat shock protein HslJ